MNKWEIIAVQLYAPRIRIIEFDAVDAMTALNIASMQYGIIINDIISIKIKGL